MYVIDGLLPSGRMGGHGFCIHLMPQFKEAVAAAELTQELVDQAIKKFEPDWLAKTGYGALFDPDNCGHLAEKHAIPGPQTRLLHAGSVRVSWGEWGPEHISVPGSACGLDVQRDGFGCVFPGGVMLSPHNVDGWCQVNLLLIAFTWFAHYAALCWTLAENKRRK